MAMATRDWCQSNASLKITKRLLATAPMAAARYLPKMHIRYSG